MRLKSISLENFRCFDHLEVPLHPRLTVLVAENAGGKTSVLDAIAIGLAPLLRAFSSASQRIGEDTDILPGFKDTDFRLLQPESKSTRGTPAWIPAPEAAVGLKTLDGLAWEVRRQSIQTSGEPGVSDVIPQELIHFATGIHDEIRSGCPWLLPVVAYYGVNRGTFETTERIRDSKINYEYPTSALVGALNPETDFKEMLKWFDLTEASELRAMREAGATGEFPEHPALNCVRDSLARLLGEEYTEPQFNKQYKLVVKSRSGPEVLQVSQLSQGYQSMLALGMDFARRLAIANPGLESAPDHPQWDTQIAPLIGQFHIATSETSPFGPAWAPAIILIDEVDLHLHPRWQQRVLTDLMRAFPLSQFIVTTHSPQVLTTVKRENIRILVKDAAGIWRGAERRRTSAAAAEQVLCDACQHC